MPQGNIFLEATTLKRLAFISLSLLLLILIPGCFTFQTSPAAIVPVAGARPIIIEFSNNPASINPGGTSTLLWNVTGANSVSIDQGIGLVNTAGAMVVSPARSTVYTISATNATGTIRSSALIIVLIIVSAPPPQTTTSNPVIKFITSHRGGTSWQLNWNVSNATQIVLQPDIGPVNPIGSTVVTVPPSGQTKLYRLEAVNDWGWSYWQVVMASP